MSLNSMRDSPKFWPHAEQLDIPLRSHTLHLYRLVAFARQAMQPYLPVLHFRHQEANLPEMTSLMQAQPTKVSDLG